MTRRRQVRERKQRNRARRSKRWILNRLARVLGYRDAAAVVKRHPLWSAMPFKLDLRSSYTAKTREWVFAPGVSVKDWRIETVAHRSTRTT